MQDAQLFDFEWFNIMDMDMDICTVWVRPFV
jgi:hypothetical protein